MHARSPCCQERTPPASRSSEGFADMSGRAQQTEEATMLLSCQLMSGARAATDCVSALKNVESNFCVCQLREARRYDSALASDFSIG
jgi:hypothetical protein